MFDVGRITAVLEATGKLPGQAEHAVGHQGPLQLEPPWKAALNRKGDGACGPPGRKIAA